MLPPELYQQIIDGLEEQARQVAEHPEQTDVHVALHQDLLKLAGQFRKMAAEPVPDELKPVKTETSYIGGAVTLKPEYGSFDLFLPVTAVQEIRKTVMPLFQGGAQ